MHGISPKSLQTADTLPIGRLPPGCHVIETSIHPLVSVIDDHPEVRDAVRGLAVSVQLECATYPSGEAFFGAWTSRQPGCLVVDVQTPKMSGFDIFNRLALFDSALPVIMLASEADVPMVLRAMKSGVFDFILKPFNERELLDSILRAVTLSTEHVAASRRTSMLHRRLDALTLRERDVLARLLDGASNKEVARALNLSPRTVETHRAHILQKLRARSLVELATALADVAVSPLRAAAE